LYLILQRTESKKAGMMSAFLLVVPQSMVSRLLRGIGRIRNIRRFDE